MIRNNSRRIDKAAVKPLASAPTSHSAAETAPPKHIEPEPQLSEGRAQLLLERALAIYQRKFIDRPQGRRFLENSGIRDASLWERHGIGYCDGKLSELLPNDEGVQSELKTLGLLLPNGRERYTGCVVIPIRDAEGQLSTLFGIRTASTARRNGTVQRRDAFELLPGRLPALWNAVTLKTHAHVILAKSIIDGLSVDTAGHANVVAFPSAAGMTAADVQTLREYGVHRVTLLLAKDKAGDQTVEATKSMLAPFFNCQVCLLPACETPNHYLRTRGREALAAFLARTESNSSGAALSTSDAAVAGITVLPGGFAVQLGVRRYEIRGLERGPRKLKATVRVEHAGRLHVDTLDFYSARSRRQLAQDLTRLFDEAANVIEGDLTKLMAGCEQMAKTTAPAPLQGQAISLSAEERAEAEALGRNPDIIQTILDDYERCGLVGERANKLLCYLAMTSRKMEKPLCVLVLSSSGAGKTTLQDMTVAFCPPEDLVKLTSLSGKALFYKEGSSLKHKVLALEEGEGVADAMYALRNLISAGELVTESTIKDPVSGRLTTMENRVEGPTAVFSTTTKPDGDPETKSRFFVTSVDESREQTQEILANQRRRLTLAGLTARLAVDPILRKHRNFQRLLKPLPVVNRYADQLGYGDDRLQGRRDQPKYLNLINAVAFLRQIQKPEAVLTTASGGPMVYIEVDREDIRLANELATEILGHCLSELSRPATDLLQWLLNMQEKPAANGAGGARDVANRQTHQQGQRDIAPEASAFTRRQIREFTGWSNARVHRYLQELIELEFVVMEHGRNGVLHRYRLAYDGQGQDGRKFLLGLKRVEELKEP